METMWKESTTRLLDRKQTPVGSMTSRQWHLAETLILHWSSSHAAALSPQNNRRHKNVNRGEDNTINDRDDWFRAMIEGNRWSLGLLDRLKEEKTAANSKAVAPTTLTTRDENPETEEIPRLNNFFQSIREEDDFRSIDISLIHVVLKQWKDALHWANKKSFSHSPNHYKVQQNKQHGDRTPHNGGNKLHRVDSKPTTKSGILLPSELLKKLDGWASPKVSAFEIGEDHLSTPLFEPNIATYTIIMDGAVSCRNYKERVVFTKELLDRLLRESSGENENAASSRLKPTVVTIGTVINALANSRNVESAQEAEDWLRRIPTLYEGSEALRPNTVIYTTVIRAWADVGRADRAEGLLREMCQEYVGLGEEGGNGESSGNPDVKPSLWTFNTVLAAWSRSKNPSSVFQAEGLIRTMKALSSKSSAAPQMDEETITDSSDANDGISNRDSVLGLNVFPTIVSYNSLMSTIARRSNEPDALAKAEYWMEEILTNASTDVRRNTSTASTNRRQTKDKGNKTGKQEYRSMKPDLNSYMALFNIIASARNMSNTEKADRMRYWLARGTSQSSFSTKNHSAGNYDERYLREHPILLERINAIEQERSKDTER